MKTFDSPSSEVIPKSIKKALGFHSKRQGEKSISYSENGMGIPRSNDIFIENGKVTQKFTKRYKN